MEKFVNDLMCRLSGKVTDEDLIVFKEVLFMAFKDYEIKKRETSLVTYEYETPREFKEYLVAKKIEGLSPKTLKQYYYCVNDFLESVRKPLKDIRTDDIRLYLYNYEKRVSGVTLDVKRLYLNTFFEWLTVNDYIRKNPCAIIKPIKYVKKIRQPLNDIEMERLRQACKTDREKAIIEVLYSTGCRVDELINLKLNDIDFDSREVFLFGKGKKERMSYLNARAILALNRYLSKRKDNSPYVFVATKKPFNNLTSRSVETIVKDLGIRASIKDKVFPHRIRHTTATDALSRGMAIEQVQTLLGHESMNTTLIYAKVNKQRVKTDFLRCIV